MYTYIGWHYLSNAVRQVVLDKWFPLILHCLVVVVIVILIVLIAIILVVIVTIVIIVVIVVMIILLADLGGTTCLTLLV